MATHQPPSVTYQPPSVTHQPPNRHQLHTNRHWLPTNRHRRAYWTLGGFFFPHYGTPCRGRLRQRNLGRHALRPSPQEHVQHILLSPHPPQATRDAFRQAAGKQTCRWVSLRQWTHRFAPPPPPHSRGTFCAPEWVRFQWPFPTTPPSPSRTGPMKSGRTKATALEAGRVPTVPEPGDQPPPQNPLP